jgi:low molecular weight protein-tyrosine phosphatase
MAPFVVLHVCMGNICRSPMAERLMVLAAQQRLAKIDAGASADDLLRSVSAGTGGWHEGEEMNPPAARQIQLRGGSADGFAARKLVTRHLLDADLILTATADQLDYVHALRPELIPRTFVLGHLARLLSEIDLSGLPPAATDPEGFAARAAAVVEAADRVRADHPALREDDLDDPWGRGDQTFTRVADEIDESVYAFMDAVLPVGPRNP